MSPIPVLLIAGHLGAGKTTLINRLLRDSDGRRIAAIVNDFGAIDIDAALLDAASDSLISLKNGCICCSLQGDLLRTLASVVRRDPAPDAIVIETSGISDPAEIIRGLLDPVIFKAAALETVVTLVDAARLAEDDAAWHDPLWLAQTRSADVLLVAKADLVGQAATAELVGLLNRDFAPRPVFVLAGELPMELLFGHGPGDQRKLSPSRPMSPHGFETIGWSSDRPLVLGRFQIALNLMSQRLLRAKGVIAFVEQSGRPLLFQLVGTRATLVPSPIPAGEGLAAAIVLIARQEAGDLAEITALLDGAVAAPD